METEPTLFPQCLTEIYLSSPIFFFSPLKTVMAKQNLWSWSLDTSPPSPQIAWFSFLFFFFNFLFIVSQLLATCKFLFVVVLFLIGG